MSHVCPGDNYAPSHFFFLVPLPRALFSPGQDLLYQSGVPVGLSLLFTLAYRNLYSLQSFKRLCRIKCIILRLGYHCFLHAMFSRRLQPRPSSEQSSFLVKFTPPVAIDIALLALLISSCLIRRPRHDPKAIPFKTLFVSLLGNIM